MSLIRLKENQFAPRCVCGHDSLYLCDQLIGLRNCDEPLCNECVKKPGNWSESSVETPIPEETTPALDRHLCARHIRHVPQKERRTFLDDFER